MAEYTPTTDDVRARYIDSRAGIGEWTRWDESVRRDVEAADTEFDRWLVAEKAKAWDEGARAGLDAGLSIAESVHANGGALDLASVPGAPINPYRKEADDE